MPVKMANNASARLAAPLDATDTTLVLSAIDAASFPVLGAGEWCPLTVIASDGQREIVKMTSRNSFQLFVERGQENTLPLNFNTSSVVECRMTAAVVNALFDEVETARNDLTDDINGLHATLSAEINEDVAQSESDDAARLALALGALIPVGFGPVPWSRTAEPAGWVFADGRTLFADSGFPALRAAYIADGFPHGQDGSGNPKIPDMRGRTVAGLDNMGGGAAGRLTGATLGAALGAETHTLTTAQLPAHNHGINDPGHAHGVTDPTHAHGVYDPGHSHTHGGPATLTDSGYGLSTSSTSYSRRVAISTSSGTFNTITSSAVGTGIGIYGAGTGVSVNAAGTGISTQNNGSGQAHNIVQPTLVCHFIVKAA